MVRRAGGVHWAPIGEKMTCAAFDSREGVAGAPSNRRSERRWDGNRAVILTPGWSLRSTPIANVRVLRARARSADAQTPRATQIAHADRPRFSRLLQVAAQGPLLVLAHVGQLAATSARVVLRGRVALYAGGLPQRSQSDRCSHPVMWLVCAHGAETATEGRHRRRSDSCGRRVARHRGLCFECRVGSIATQDISPPISRGRATIRVRTRGAPRLYRASDHRTSAQLLCVRVAICREAGAGQFCVVSGMLR